MDKKRYGQTILDTRRSFSIIKTPFTTYFSGGTATLRRRLKSVLDTQIKPTGMWLLLLVVVLALVLGDLVALWVSACIGDTGSLPAVNPVDPPAQVSSSEPAPPSSSQPAVVAPPASSSEASSSTASSSESSSSETSSSEVSSSEASSSEGSSSAPEKVVKTPGEVPDRHFFLPVIEQIITEYRNGTADTSMLDPNKPVLMPLPAGAQKQPEMPTDTTAFNVMINAQGFGIVLPFDDNAWAMNIWVRDDGPADEYQFVVTAVSFTQGTRRTASATMMEPTATAPKEDSAAESSAPASSVAASSSNATSNYAARKEELQSPFKRSSSGLLK